MARENTAQSEPANEANEIPRRTLVITTRGGALVLDAEETCKRNGDADAIGKLAHLARRPRPTRQS